jgi:hypothetical protein
MFVLAFLTFLNFENGMQAKLEKMRQCEQELYDIKARIG